LHLIYQDGKEHELIDERLAGVLSHTAAHFVLSEKAIPNFEKMTDNKDGHYGLEQLLQSVDGQQLRTAYLLCNQNGTTLYWLSQLFSQSMEADRLGHYDANSELGRFLHSVEIQHLYALYLHNHPTGTTLFWFHLLVSQSVEAVRLEAAAAAAAAAAAVGNVDNTTDDDDASMCLPSGASYEGNKSGNGSSSSSSDGSLNGQYAPGPHAEGGVLASLPLLLTSAVGNRECEASNGSTARLEAYIEGDSDSKDSDYVPSSDSGDSS
jgi:hypothetical protein